jgi:hypothetical protein
MWVDLYTTCWWCTILGCIFSGVYTCKIEGCQPDFEAVAQIWSISNGARNACIPGTHKSTAY